MSNEIKKWKHGFLIITNMLESCGEIEISITHEDGLENTVYLNKQDIQSLINYLTTILSK